MISSSRSEACPEDRPSSRIGIAVCNLGPDEWYEPSFMETSDSRSAESQSVVSGDNVKFRESTAHDDAKLLGGIVTRAVLPLTPASISVVTSGVFSAIDVNIPMSWCEDTFLEFANDEENKGEQFKCHECDKTYLNKKTLRNHQVNFHKFPPMRVKFTTKPQPYYIEHIEGERLYYYDTIEVSKWVYRCPHILPKLSPIPFWAF